MYQPLGKCPCFCSTPTAEGLAARGSSPTAGLACIHIYRGGSACRSEHTAPSPRARGCVREVEEGGGGLVLQPSASSQITEMVATVKPYRVPEESI